MKLKICREERIGSDDIERLGRAMLPHVRTFEYEPLPDRVQILLDADVLKEHLIDIQVLILLSEHGKMMNDKKRIKTMKEIEKAIQKLFEIKEGK